MGGIRIGLMRQVITGGAALQQPPLSSAQQAGGTPVKEPDHDVGGGRPLAAGGSTLVLLQNGQGLESTSAIRHDDWHRSAWLQVGSKQGNCRRDY